MERLYPKLIDGLSEGQQETLLAAIAAAPGKVYVVGGVVRDLLLNHPIADRDIDLTVEVPAHELVAAIRGRVESARVVAHPPFGTVELTFPDGSIVDIATTRTERYPQPAKLPQVSLGASIEDDLTRRDFSINAIALQLGGRGGETLIDPLGGMPDLKKRLVRILHPNSFIDDPTRAWRAARYVSRLGFRVDPHTQAQMIALAARPDLLNVAHDRIFNEMRLILIEPRWITMLEWLEKWQLLAWVHAGLPAALKRARHADDAVDRFQDPKLNGAIDPIAVRWLVLLSGLDAGELEEILRRFPFNKAFRHAAESWKRRGPAVRAISRARAMSAIWRQLRLWPDDALAALTAVSTSPVRKKVLRYCQVAKTVQPPLTGHDLSEAGIPPGPDYAVILEKAQALAIDNKWPGRDSFLSKTRRGGPACPP